MTWLYTNQWAAGFFDGEGCITVERRRDGAFGSLCLQVTQKVQSPLRAVYPFSIVKRRQIEIAFSYLETMGNVGERTPAEILRLRETLVMNLANEKRNWGV